MQSGGKCQKNKIETFSQSLLTTNLSTLLGKSVEVLKDGKSFVLKDEAEVDKEEEEKRRKAKEEKGEKQNAASSPPGTATATGGGSASARGSKVGHKSGVAVEKVLKLNSKNSTTSSKSNESGKSGAKRKGGKVLQLLGTEALECARMRFDSDVGKGFFVYDPRHPVTHVWCEVEWTCWGTIPNLRQIHFYNQTELKYVYKHDQKDEDEEKAAGKKE